MTTDIDGVVEEEQGPPIEQSISDETTTDFRKLTQKMLMNNPDEVRHVYKEHLADISFVHGYANKHIF